MPKTVSATLGHGAVGSWVSRHVPDDYGGDVARWPDISEA